MRHILPALAAVALLAIPASTRAGVQTGINLGWDICGPARVAEKSFACDVNTGQDLLWISFVPPAGITALTGIETKLELQTEAATLPPWWQFQTGGCRATVGIALVTSTPEAPSTCAAPWITNGIGGFGFPLSQPGPGRTPLWMVTAVDVPSYGPLTAGVEYHHAAIAVKHARTVGTTTCAGCDVGVCIALVNVRLVEDYAVDPYPVDLWEKLDRTTVLWQPTGTPPAECFQSVPVKNRTWGSIKSLYR